MKGFMPSWWFQDSRQAADANQAPVLPRQTLSGSDIATVSGRTCKIWLCRGSAQKTMSWDLSLNGLTVLVVDDHADSRDLAATILRLAGASVSTAASGRE